MDEKLSVSHLGEERLLGLWLPERRPGWEKYRAEKGSGQEGSLHRSDRGSDGWERQEVGCREAGRLARHTALLGCQK